MAFVSRIGNMLRQTSCKLPRFDSSAASSSIYQAIRCFSSKIFVGGLSYATDEKSLREVFIPYGDVTEARIIVDRETGRSRGFGFISYASTEEASAAIQALDGRDLHGRYIKVAYADDKGGRSPGPRFSNVGYGATGNNTGENHSSGGSNYGSGGGYSNYGRTGGGSTVGYGCSYETPTFGKYEGVAGHGNGGTGYSVQSHVQSHECASNNGENVVPGDEYGRHDISNKAGGTYGFSAGDNFGGHAADVGNHSGGGLCHDGNASNYDTTYSEANKFNLTSYHSVQ